MIHQLWIYEIFEDAKGAFHARSRDRASRLMRRHGFHIVCHVGGQNGQANRVRPPPEWPDGRTKASVWAAFMDDRQWAEIKPLHRPKAVPWSAR
jgi:hypothetical protein